MWKKMSLTCNSKQQVILDTSDDEDEVSSFVVSRNDWIEEEAEEEEESEEEESGDEEPEWSGSDCSSEALAPPPTLKRCQRPTTIAATQVRAAKKQTTLQTKCITDGDSNADIFDQATSSQRALVEPAERFVMVMMANRPTVIDTFSIDPETDDVGIKTYSIKDFFQFYNGYPKSEEEEEEKKKTQRSLSSSLPRYEAIVCNPNVESVDQKKFFNLWQTFSVPLVEATKGECENAIGSFLDRLWSLCSNDPELYGYVFKWLAHSIQRPHQSPGTALVLRDHGGDGVSLFQIFGKLFGRHFKQTHGLCPVTETLEDPVMWDGLFLLCKDADRIETPDRLHQIVTDPLLLIESDLHFSERRASSSHAGLKKNRFHVVLTSRNPDHLFGTSINTHRARSYIYLDDSPSLQSLEEEQQEECCINLAALLCYFSKHVDITSFDPKEVPMTPAWLEVVKSGQSFPPFERWLYDTVLSSTTTTTTSKFNICSISTSSSDKDGDGDGKTRTIQKQDLYTAYLEWCRDMDQHEEWKGAVDFCLKMKQVFPHATLSRSQPGDSNRYFTFGSLQQMREDFAHHVKLDLSILWPSYSSCSYQ